MNVSPWWMWLVIGALALATVGLAVALIYLLRWLSHLFDGFR